MIVSTPAFLRADNFEEVIVSAVSMIFGLGMGPPEFAFKPESHAQKNLTTDIVHLFRPNSPKLLRDHLKKRGSASTSAHEFAMTAASRSLATAPARSLAACSAELHH
jgi:hypothetical protein